MKRKMLAFVAVLALAFPPQALAAIGCTLSNPAQDLKSLFPEMTTYKEELKEFPRLKDGAALYEAFKVRVGAALDPVYEGFGTPYTLYTVFKGKEKIGIVHGVNMPGRGGVIQVFLWTDPATAEIRKFFFQRLESPAAKALRAKDFRARFEGLTLADFYKHDYYSKAKPGDPSDKVGALPVPPGLDADGAADHAAALRGVRKDLVLLDLFVYGRRFDPFFERAHEREDVK